MTEKKPNARSGWREQPARADGLRRMLGREVKQWSVWIRGQVAVLSALVEVFDEKANAFEAWYHVAVGCSHDRRALDDEVRLVRVCFGLGDAEERDATIGDDVTRHLWVRA